MTTDERTRATLADEGVPRSRRDGVVTLEGRLLLGEAAADEPGGPSPGDRIGRYILLHRVGAGGMGIVFAAQDPELDRIVALKVLPNTHRDRGPAGRARFVREAQAMARLTHPNVVEVYDVGTTGDAVFIAMELVDGVTLKRWLDAKQPWREVLRTFAAAGRGLAAAHAQGIVHRDFKPDNVLLSIDRPTRAVTGVRVVDFGLARGTSSLDSAFSADPLVSSRSPAEVSADEDLARPLGQTQLTGEGTVMGTPGYMAPEQHRGRPIDARADQYAFCVALFEALWGVRPFQGRSLSELLRAKERGALPSEPEHGGVPRRIRDAIVRGLSPWPDARWPGMDALIHALERELRPHPVFPWIAAAIVVGGAILVVAQPWATAAAGCDDPEQRLAAVWNDDRRTAAASAFEAIGAAGEGWPKTEVALDGYAVAWVAEYRSACAAAADVERDRRMQCLGDRLDTLDTVIGVLADADGEAVRRSLAVTTGLPAPSSCEGGEQVLPLPPEPERAAAVVDVRRRLHRARLLDEMGRWPTAVDVAETASAAATELQWPPLQAESKVILGGALERVGEYARARALLEDGVLEAVGLGLDRVALEGIIELTYLIGFRNEDLAGAQLWARQGLALVQRVGAERDVVEASLLNAIGPLHDAAGEFAKSKEQFERARELFEAAYGPNHPHVATARQNVGIELTRLGHYEAARDELSRALAIYRKTNGDTHPDTANALDNLGAALQRLGQNAEAEAATREALAIRQNVLGTEHPEVARSYTNLGAFAGAEAHYGRAAAIFAAVMGQDNATTAAAHVNHAFALERAGDPTRALELLRSARARLQKLLPPKHPHHAFVHLGLARVHLALAEPDVALAHAEQALELCRTGEVEPIACAQAEFQRGRALWSVQARRPEALAATKAARTALQSTGDLGSPELAEIDAWLREHDR